jgi:hypothetical protein
VNKILHLAGTAAGAVAVVIAAGAFTLTPVSGSRGAAHRPSAGDAAHRPGARDGSARRGSARRGSARSGSAPVGRARGGSRAANRPRLVRPGQPMIGLRAAAKNREVAGPAAARRITRSVNWAGYAATRRGKSFRLAQATFFVPYLDCKVSPGTYSADWVGFDGFLGAKPDSVEQDGIEADCLGHAGKTPRYHAWYELFPRPEVVSGIKINAGDSVTASVAYLPARKRFRLVIKDNTNGRHFRVTKACAAARCPRSSAQVISEAPANNKGELLPLADYGAVSFAGIAITDGAGHHGGLVSRRWRTSKIVQFGDASRQRIAQPTPIHDGRFANYWLGEI